MKRLTVTVFIVLILSLSVTSNVFGMAAYYSGEPDDQWYTVTPDKPYVQASYSCKPATDTDDPNVFGEFYQNDQTFFNIDFSNHYSKILYYQNGEYTSSRYFDSWEINASYLFNNGIFIGWHRFKISPTSYYDRLEQSIYSAGYRYNFDKFSYLALSVDYQSDDQAHEIAGYEINYRKFLDKMKINGQFYKYSNSDNLSEQTDEISTSVAYQLSDATTLGFVLSRLYQKTCYNTGLTWKYDSFVANFRLGNTFYKRYANGSVEFGDFYHVNCIYYLTSQFGVGFTTFRDSISDSAQNTYSLKQQVGKGAFKLEYVDSDRKYTKKYQFNYSNFKMS